MSPIPAETDEEYGFIPVPLSATAAVTELLLLDTDLAREAIIDQDFFASYMWWLFAAE